MKIDFHCVVRIHEWVYFILHYWYVEMRKRIALLAHICCFESIRWSKCNVNFSWIVEMKETSIGKRNERHVVWNSSETSFFIDMKSLEFGEYLDFIQKLLIQSKYNLAVYTVNVILYIMLNAVYQTIFNLLTFSYLFDKRFFFHETLIIIIHLIVFVQTVFDVIAKYWIKHSINPNGSFNQQNYIFEKYISKHWNMIFNE